MTGASNLPGRVRSRFRRIGGVIESPGMFYEDDAFWVNGKEIARFDGDDAIELRLTRPVIRALRGDFAVDHRVQQRRPSSDWVTVSLRHARDVALVESLARHAVAAHMPPDGTTPEPPPTGEALAGRKRFH